LDEDSFCLYVLQRIAQDRFGVLEGQSDFH
jgi:hypothetical protein